MYINFSASPQNLVTSEVENTAASDSDYSSECMAELMNYDEPDEWLFSPSNLSNQVVPSFSLTPFSSSFSPFDEFEYSFGDYMSRSDQVSYGTERGVNVIPRCPKTSLNERLFKALHLCTPWFGGGTLAQVWVPTRDGGRLVLTTSEQPFIHDGRLSEYREVSRMFTFAAEIGSSSLLGVPGRVFTSNALEWTSNVNYYSKEEYLRVKYAVDLHVRGSIALPVFEDSGERRCCAVLEIVTTEEKPNFDSEMDNICRALQAVDLTSTQSPVLSPKSLSRNQNAALGEMRDILYAICCAHCLPLALTWTLRTHSKNGVHNGTIPSLFLEETTCYWNDSYMEGFMHACKNHFLEEGKGLVGKALLSDEPFFSPDVREFNVSEYPLVHHARKIGLRAAVAVRIRSDFTGGDECIVEFFLPLNLEGEKEQLLLVSKLVENMERICGSSRLSKVSGAKLVEVKKPGIHLLSCGAEDISTADELQWNERDPANSYGTSLGMTNNDPIKKETTGISRKMEKKGYKSEKIISLSVLQQYFSQSLKDAAKNLDVSPTTLKKICRLYGISRWPSRKLKKVDHSLRKIQSMLVSVPGMDGGLEFDPTKGHVFASFSLTGEEFDGGKNLNPTSQNSLSKPLDTLVPNPATSEVIDAEREEDHSNTRDSLNRSGSMLMTNVSLSSSGSFDEKSPPRRESSYGYIGTKIIVKAMLGENMIRFKFEPDLGCFELYSEVAKRFELEPGEFQLRYLDDDDEWVLMATDLDMIECLEVLEVLQTRTVKFGVDVSMRNSGTNTHFLARGN